MWPSGLDWVPTVDWCIASSSCAETQTVQCENTHFPFQDINSQMSMSLSLCACITHCSCSWYLLCRISLSLNFFRGSCLGNVAFMRVSCTYFVSPIGHMFGSFILKKKSIGPRQWNCSAIVDMHEITILQRCKYILVPEKWKGSYTNSITDVLLVIGWVTVDPILLGSKGSSMCLMDLLLVYRLYRSQQLLVDVLKYVCLNTATRAQRKAFWTRSARGWRIGWCDWQASSIFIIWLPGPSWAVHTPRGAARVARKNARWMEA